MTNSDISILGEFLLLEQLPDIKIEKRKGEVAYRITVSIDAAFTSTIIAGCTIGSTVTITVGNVVYEGILTGFGVRSGFGIVQIENATIV